MKTRTLSFLSASLAVIMPFTAAAQGLGIQVIIDGKTVVFSDVPQSAWFATYVRSSAEAGIVSGYKDTNGKLSGKYGPSNSITVAEALKIAVEGAGYDEELYGSQIDSGVEHWSSAYVSVAMAEHFDLTSLQNRLDRAATRAEVAAIFTSAFRVDVPTPMGGRYDDVGASTKYAGAVEALSRDGVVSGDTDIHGQAVGTFRPIEPINRAEVAKMVIEARAEYGTPGMGRTPVAGGMHDEYMFTYSDNGFTPSVIRVPKGATVTFKNESSGGLWVASNPHPAHTDLSGFDVDGILKAGETYTYTFTKIGSFGFHNHISSQHTGTVIVE